MYIVKGGGLRIESDARHASVSAETVLGYVEVPALLRATTLAEAARRRNVADASSIKSVALVHIFLV